ncbi:uncharacterized protein LOC120336188 [Styela clava]
MTQTCDQAESRSCLGRGEKCLFYGTSVLKHRRRVEEVFPCDGIFIRQLHRNIFVSKQKGATFKNSGKRVSGRIHFYAQMLLAVFVFVSWITTASTLPIEPNESMLIPELKTIKTPSASSELMQRSSENKNNSKHPILQEIISLEDFKSEADKPIIEAPKLQAVRKRYKKCKNPYRKDYCMNGGRCEWISALEQPRCACKNGWKGERCRTYQVDFDQGEAEPRDQTLVISLVLSLFGVLGIALVGCICWRRVKFLQTHKDEINENTAMVTCEQERSNSVPR